VRTSRIRSRGKPGSARQETAAFETASRTHEYVFLSPEWIHEVARAVQSAREGDLYFRNLVAGISLKLAYIIRGVPKPLSHCYGGDSQATVFVRIDKGAVGTLIVGRELPEEEAQVLVTTEYKTAKELFLGESSPVATVLSQRLKAEPVNGFRGWPSLAAKSLLTASNVLRVARKVSTVFEPEAVSIPGQVHAVGAAAVEGRPKTVHLVQPDPLRKLAAD